MKRSGLNVLGIIFGILSIIIVFTVAAILIGQQSFRTPLSFNFNFNLDNFEDVFKGNELEEKDEETFRGTYKEIQIEAISGDIEVTGWNEEYVLLEYVKAAPTDDHLEALRVEIEENDDELAISREFTGSGITPRGEIDFSLSVPREMLQELELKTISGTVLCSNLHRDIDMAVQTTSGRIKTDVVNNLTAKTISGEITFIAYGNDIDIRTTSGRVTGELRQVDKDGSIQIHSVSGAVKLIVPDSFEADVDLRSVAGSVDTDLPIKVTSSKRNSLEGTIGGGGISVDIDTTSGSIRIEKTTGNE